MAESNVMAGAMTGAMSSAIGSSVGSSGLLRFNLGYWQVYDGSFVSFSQTGDFSGASRDGADIVATGPSALYPDARLRKRRLTGAEWENAIIFLTVSGQSTAMGATTGATEEGSESASPFYTILPPLPGKLKGPTGGTIPNQAGGGSPANATIIDPATYASLVDLCEGINVGRTGADVDRETPGMTMATVLADAVPDGSIVVLVNTGAGSSDFAETVGKSNSITGYTWSEPSGPGSGQIVFNTFASHYVQVGASWTVSGITPSAANGTYTVTARTSSTITVAKATDPTAWVSGGTFDDPSICWQNTDTIIDHVIANLAEGRTPKYAGHLHMGNEGNSTTGTEAVFAISAALIRSYVDARGLRIEGSAVSRPLIWPGVNNPRGVWNDDEARVSEASWHGMGQLYIIENGIDANLVTTPLYFADSGYGSPVGSPHYDQKGYMRIGAKEGHLLLDKLLGVEIDPPCIVDDTLERVATSATFTGTLSGTFVKDTTEVSDPGNSGIQFFTADTDLYTATLTEQDVGTVTVGSTISVVADAVPDPRRNWITAGFKNATQTIPWCGLEVTNGTWDGSTVTLTLDGTHSLPIGTSFSLFNVFGAGTVTGLTTITGSTGSTLKYASASSPGTFTPGGFVTRSAVHCVGNGYGNRTTLRLADVRHYSPLDGAPLPDYMVQHKRQAKVYPSVPGLIDQINELDALITGGMTFGGVWDIADADCYPGTGQLITNLGTGSNLNFYNGTTSGTDASFDMVFVGTADSKDRNTYFEVGAGITGRWTAVGTPTLCADTHKTGGLCFGLAEITYAAGASAQYIWTTSQQEGAGAAAGTGLRISSAGVPTFRVANASNGTVWSLLSSVTLTPGERYVIAWGLREGGRSFLWVNGTLTEDTSTIYTSPAATSALPLQIGVAGASGNRRLQPGFRIHALALHDTLPGGMSSVTFGDIEPLVNGAYRRHIEDAY